MSSSQPVCGLQGGGSERTDTDLCGWPYSQQFAQFITTQNVSDSEVLVSFDVVSLFTRVPTSRAIQVTRDRLMNDPSLPDRTSLTVDDICSLLQLCLEATYLAFEGKVYRQIHGTAMGSPVSVVVANLVMEDVEQEALSTFHTPPRFWRRYVDDTCTALPNYPNLSLIHI